ncbi:hypothetical protein VIBNISOn1_1920029 [Vibrio nigripulchritudo SOn1]|uniref:Transposase n=1 Tax=Vibrio nigripulchritudo SOn1 TaxID=1238450 RepID=A0AAV2VQB2_9VIBR|nr:hypothetical protein VIBNISOn1_1920029 [Vibrio nigripulchritudo SOn1]
MICHCLSKRWQILYPNNLQMLGSATRWIFDLESPDRQIDALSENQANLAETNTLRRFEYITCSNLLGLYDCG